MAETNIKSIYSIPSFDYGKDDKTLAKGASYSLVIAAPMDARTVLTSWNDLKTIGGAVYPGLTFYIKETGKTGEFYIVSAVPDVTDELYDPSTWNLTSREAAEAVGFGFLSIGEDTNTKYYVEAAADSGISVSTSTDENGDVTYTLSHNLGPIYVVKGSSTIEDLNDADATHKAGDVYNVSDATGFYLITTTTTTEDGPKTTTTISTSPSEDTGATSVHYPPYTNVVYTEDGWDSLGGTVVDVTTKNASASALGAKTGAPIISIDVEGLVSLSNPTISEQLSVSIDIDQLATEMLSVGDITVTGSHIGEGSGTNLSFNNGELSGTITVNVEDIEGGSATASAAEGSGLTGDITVSIASNGAPTIINNLKADVNNIAAKWIWLCQESTEPSTTVNIFAVEP